MSYKKVCDLCGKEIVTCDYREFKIKERRGWLESYWVELDAHDECVRKLVDAVKINPPTPSVGSVQNDLLRNCIDDVIERNNGKEGQAIKDYDGCADVRSVQKETNDGEN